VLNDEDQDTRIRIGAAIALCQLREERAVAYLLDELDRFQEAIKQENISETRLNDLTELRIGAQEALTASGDFVVPFLMNRLREQKPGPIIIWAAAKTLGELGVEEVLPFLNTYVTATAAPKTRVEADGQIVTKEGTDWRELAEDKADELRASLESFTYPDYVRWTSAIALGQIGGKQAVASLRQAESLENDFLARLHANRRLKAYFERAPVLDPLIAQHEDVLFYVRQALKGLGEDV